MFSLPPPQVSLSLLLSAAAAFSDLRRQRIPNHLTVSAAVAGVFLMLYTYGPSGLLYWGAGLLLPVLLFGPLFRFRMAGAGDIKLLCALGSLNGPAICLRLIVKSVLLGGLGALLLAAKRRILVERLMAFFSYVRESRASGTPRPYLPSVPPEACLPFALPVLCAVLWEFAPWKGV